jgi:hypothetical protein
MRTVKCTKCGYLDWGDDVTTAQAYGDCLKCGAEVRVFFILTDHPKSQRTELYFKALIFLDYYEIPIYNADYEFPDFINEPWRNLDDEEILSIMAGAMYE